jgi:hypothetical protein
MWVRRKDEPEHPRGMGVEILYLDDDSRDWMVEWIEKNKPVSFIRRN